MNAYASEQNVPFFASHIIYQLGVKFHVCFSLSYLSLRFFEKLSNTLFFLFQSSLITFEQECVAWTSKEGFVKLVFLNRGIS